MNKPQNPLIRLWKWWFTVRSTDPTISYRERALRFLLPIFVLLRAIAFIDAYFIAGITKTAPPRLLPVWAGFLFLAIPLVFSFYFLSKHEVGYAGAFFILGWYLLDMGNLPVDGYWNPGYQISIILQIILATLLLPGRAIIPFTILLFFTVGIWGMWLDLNYYTPPLLSTGEPVSTFSRAIVTLSVQGFIIMLLVRYLRMEMEKSLRLQQTNIKRLEEEIAERFNAEEQVKQLNLELENRVHERTAQLETANKELESFSYSVSHDLRAPLRAITGFTRIIRNDFSAGLDPRGIDFLEKVIDSAVRMNRLIDDLLSFSRTSQKEPNKQEVDLNIVTQTVIESLTPEIGAREIEWIRPCLPPAHADPTLIQQVYANLIGNAVKYTRQRNPAQIEISSFTKNDEIVYLVRDNGAGFDMQYAEKLFGVFQRMHSEAEFEGTGIGLATVRRIIERHGGRIWAEAEVDKGATFYFTLG